MQFPTFYICLWITHAIALHNAIILEFIVRLLTVSFLYFLRFDYIISAEFGRRLNSYDRFVIKRCATVVSYDITLITGDKNVGTVYLPSENATNIPVIIYCHGWGMEK
jgi:hypothetical protein